ncbi:MAG: HAMP domain-containing histidine kinase [Prevotellaceae bacterium]|nr:HAMP domain-containing histidine kinase [Prevotellaceae bacterium]
MKLLSYTYRNLMLWMLLFMSIWGVLFYYSILYEVTDETDDTLRNDSNILINKALHDPSILDTSESLMSFYSFRPISDDEAASYRTRFFDSTVYIEIEDEYEPVRVMQTVFLTNDGQHYELELKISTLERDNMIRAIVGYLIALFVLFIACTLIGTRLVLRHVFRPMHRLMEWLHRLEPGKEVPPLERATNITEFVQLSDAAVVMGNRAHKAYREQKEFIENASHELQTPLAIARGKVELLAESDGLTELQLRELDEIYGTLGRAVRLNKSLLLLTRIENGQYAETEAVNTDALIDELLPDLLDIYAAKHIRLTRLRSEEQPFIVRGNPALVQILLSNLLKNALLHNCDGGVLYIETTRTSLTIKNTGQQALDADRLFRRFYRGANKSDSTGLGLAIAGSIAASTALDLQYRWEEGMHSFSLTRLPA